MQNNIIKSVNTSSTKKCYNKLDKNIEKFIVFTKNAKINYKALLCDQQVEDLKKKNLTYSRTKNEIQ